MSKHTCWSFFNKCLEVSGLVAVLVVFNEGLWSWIEAILQESMPSVLIHMPHTFQCPFFVWVMAAGVLADASLFYPGEPKLGYPRKVHVMVLCALLSSTILQDVLLHGHRPYRTLFPVC